MSSLHKIPSTFTTFSPPSPPQTTSVSCFRRKYRVDVTRTVVGAHHVHLCKSVLFFSFLYSLINVLFTPRTTTSTGPFRPVPNNPVRSNLPPACSIPNHWRATCRTIPFSPHRPRAFVANRKQERNRGR